VTRLAIPFTWLLLCAALLQVAAGGGTSTTVAVIASALVVGLAGRLVVSLLPDLSRIRVSSPARRRLHGRFLQQSRPGVPGRTRSRAPGCGH
jgi:hypothetical protein